MRWEIDLTCHNCNETYAEYADKRDFRYFKKSQEDDAKEARQMIAKEADKLAAICLEELEVIFRKAYEDDLIGAEDFRPRPIV